MVNQFFFRLLAVLLIGLMMLAGCSDSDKLVTDPEPYIPPSDTQPEPLVVEGKVVDVNNQPMADVTVDLVDADGLLLLQVATDLLGNYYFEADMVETTTLTAIARKEGYISASSRVNIVGNMARTSVMTLRTRPQAIRQEISREGGVIEGTTEVLGKSLQVELDVPADALDATRELSVTPMRYDELEGNVSIFDYLAATELGPGDVEFNVPVTVTFSLRTAQVVGHLILVRTYNESTGEWEQAVDENNHPLFATVIEDPQYEGQQISQLARIQLTRFAANGNLRQSGDVSYVLSPVSGNPGGGSLTAQPDAKETQSVMFVELDPDERSYTLNWQSDLIFPDPNDVGDFTAAEIDPVIRAALGTGGIPFNAPRSDVISYAPGAAPTQVPSGAREPGNWSYHPFAAVVVSHVPATFSYYEIVGGTLKMAIDQRVSYIDQSVRFPDYMITGNSGGFLPTALAPAVACSGDEIGSVSHTFQNSATDPIDLDLVANYGFGADQVGTSVNVWSSFLWGYCYAPTHDQ